MTQSALRLRKLSCGIISDWSHKNTKIVRIGNYEMSNIGSLSSLFTHSQHIVVLAGQWHMVYLYLILRNPATFLHAYTCLPLAYPTRQAAGAILQDVADSGALFAILMCKHKVAFLVSCFILLYWNLDMCSGMTFLYLPIQVISLVGAQKASLHPDDMLLLSNFILSSESFRLV